MALASEQKSSRLFKKSFGLAETLTARDFFEEAIVGPSLILPTQIWAEADKIPTVAPILTDGVISGVIQYYETLELTHISGSQDRSYSDVRLKDAIDFTTDASYNYKLYKNDGTTQIPDGLGDWLVDREAGVLTFYGTLPAGVSAAVPPRISFYKYVGIKGLELNGATAGINVKDPVIAASTIDISNYSNAISGFTVLPVNIDGIVSFNNGDRFLIKDQIDARQNGIFQVSGSTLIRSIDNDGQPTAEVGVNDYVFVTSGTTLIATSWVMGSSNALDENNIIPGVDTQNWKLFSESRAYEASETGLKLNNNQFYIDIDETGVYGSGLEQGVDGIRVKSDILSTITANDSSIVSLSTGLSTEISARISGDESLSTDISSMSSLTTTLSTDISTEVSARISGDESLSSAVSTEISTEVSARISGDESLSTAISTISSSTTTLSTDISTEVSARISGDESLSTGLSTEVSARISGDESISTVISNLEASLSSNVSTDTSLSTAISSEISTEVSARISGDESLSTIITNLGGNALEYTGNTLNVKVDDFTIKIVNDELRGQQTWIQNTSLTNITGGTSGYTGLVLDFDPITPVFAYVNGIEYLIYPSTFAQTNFPFYYSQFPPITGTQIGFDASIAGFDLESGIDLVTIKYSYIDIT